jgi:ABC-type transporter lipoprotein component MlaA
LLELKLIPARDAVVAAAVDQGNQAQHGRCSPVVDPVEDHRTVFAVHQENSLVQGYVFEAVCKGWKGLHPDPLEVDEAGFPEAGPVFVGGQVKGAGARPEALVQLGQVQ